MCRMLRASLKMAESMCVGVGNSYIPLLLWFVDVDVVVERFSTQRTLPQICPKSNSSNFDDQMIDFLVSVGSSFMFFSFFFNNSHDTCWTTWTGPFNKAETDSSALWSLNTKQHFFPITSAQRKVIDRELYWFFAIENDGIGKWNSGETIAKRIMNK